MTDAELIAAAHAILLSALKQDIDAEAAVLELTGLFEENGHPFIGSVGWPANDPS